MTKLQTNFNKITMTISFRLHQKNEKIFDMCVTVFFCGLIIVFHSFNLIICFPET